MTKPHAQAKSGSARTAQSAIQKDILPLEQMMAPDETNVQAQPSTEQDNNGTLSPAPELRFEGFFEPWHKRQLMDVAQIIGGGTPSTSIKAYWDGSINWFTPAELGDHIFVYHSERKITQQGIEHSTAKLLPQGTILYYSRGAGLGKTAILATPSTTNQGFQSIVPSPKELDSYFIFSCSNQLKAYGVSVGGGSTFKEVSGKQMEVMPLLIPSLPEQQRIGTLFKELDRNLSLNRAQLEKLTQLKTSMLEQMFPQEDEDVPRLRFNGFTEPWQKITLNEASSNISDGVHNLPPEAKEGEGIPILSAKDIDDFGNLLFNDVARHASYQSFQSEFKRNEGISFGDVLITIVGSIGRVAIVNTTRCFMLQRSVAIIKPQYSKIRSDFLHTTITHPSSQIWLNETAAGSTQKGIYLNKLSSMVIMAPNLAEQERIGAFFKALDERLALQRAKIEKLEQLKKALLEQMFV